MNAVKTTLFSFFTLLCSQFAIADIVVGRTPVQEGPIVGVHDCETIRMTDHRDRQFFREACLGTVVSNRILSAVAGPTIDRPALLNWLATSNVQAWVRQNVPELLPGDVGPVAVWAQRILGVLDFPEPNDAWVFFVQYPSIKERCFAEHKQFHGSLDFTFVRAGNSWVASGIEDDLRCR